MIPRVPGRLGPRAQSPPKPRCDRFVDAAAGKRRRKSALTRGARSGSGAAVSWWCTLSVRILKATRSSGGTQETIKIHRRPEMSESQVGFDRTIDKRDNTIAKCRKTVRRSSSSEFLVWGCITMLVLLEDSIQWILIKLSICLSLLQIYV
ncbi:hypothetical protein ALC62_02162 [Cyphomyrmex costatus]|uniref:Uncharacterized protein n=1 Tax=Cyphomyrmex costatus TaxID=456900 RepID=A0A195D227_9HYME|nr:hypothetical protein ALC62_02162 [Cyphomyrmex costatus]